MPVPCSKPPLHQHSAPSMMLKVILNVVLSPGWQAHQALPSASSAAAGLACGVTSMLPHFKPYRLPIAELAESALKTAGAEGDKHALCCWHSVRARHMPGSG